jgi:DNA primase
LISRDTARIEEVIGDFVTLRRRGVNMIGHCPFHNEKTPSFTVSPAKGIYKCFGCGKAGNSVNFLMEHEHYTYPEALRALARKYNIEIEEEALTQEQIQETSEKESLFNLNLYALQYFSGVLFDSEEGRAIGLSYLKERGIREDISRKFQLGYSLDKWNSFSESALQNGYKKEFLLKTGLSQEKDSRLYDRFHSRLIFPIHSASGRIIGFGGRILGPDKNRAKYINSPESDIYSKSKSLYGIFFAKNAIISKDSCLLVEGYTDVISLVQSGVENVVASSGTSLTTDQIRMIQRYTSNITILYDGDPAGIKASFRGIDMILEQGMNVKIVLFPDGEDPDSYARKHRPAEVQDFIRDNAVNFILFKTRLLLDEARADPIKKATLIKEIVASVALMPDAISRSLYIKECSSLMAVQENILMNELNRLLRKKIFKNAAAEALPEEVLNETPVQEIRQEVDFESAEYQEKEVIRILLMYGQDVIHIKRDPKDQEDVPVMVADFVVHDILRDELGFDNTVYRQIFEIYVKGLNEEYVPDRNFFLSNQNREISGATVDLIFTPYELSLNWAKNNIVVETEEMRMRLHIDHTILSFKARKIKKMIEDLRKKLHAKNTPEDEKRLLEQWKALKKTSIDVHKKLGRIITP